MKDINITQHACERSIERLGLTGVELLSLIKRKVKPHKFKEGAYHISIKHKPRSFKLIMNDNNVITIYLYPTKLDT